MRTTRLPLLALAALCLAGAARADQVPDPTKSSVPSYVKVAGTQAGVPDPRATFTVTLRDFANNPIAGHTVTVDFSNCTDLVLCGAQADGAPLDCAAKTVSRVSNAAGQAAFIVLGGGIVAGTTLPPAIAPGAERSCARVFDQATHIGTVTAVIFDPNGALPAGNGVTSLDLSIVKNDIGAAGLGAPYRGRSDHSTDGTLSAVDLAFMKTVVGLALSGLGSGSGCATAAGAASYCP